MGLIRLFKGTKIHLIIMCLLSAAVFLAACGSKTNVNTAQTGNETKNEETVKETSTEKKAVPETSTAKETTPASSENVKTTTAEDEATYRNYSVTFDRIYDAGTESAIITAHSGSGEIIWTVNTETHLVAQLNSCENIGICGDRYYYVEAGTIKAVSLSDGSLLWENSDFKGSKADNASAFGPDGTLYISGYLSPDLFIADKNGKTVKRIDELTQDYYWPFKVEYLGEKLAITFEGTPNQQPATLYVDLNTFDVSDKSEGHMLSTPPETDYDVDAEPVIAGVSASSHLSEPEYNVDHTADSATDRNITTAWCENAPGQGIGEWLEISFDKTYTVKGVTIYAGFQESSDLYYKNSRPADLTIEFSDGSSQSIHLDDVMDGQKINFDNQKETASLKFIINSVYEGNRYEDTLITDIIPF